MQEELKENKEEKKNDLSNQNLIISWDDYFATIAEITSLRSKDPVRKVGAIIVSNDNKILSTGYNGAPRGICDDDIPWEKFGEFLDTKYPYIVHAELNAILNYNNDKSLLQGARIYTTLFPCNECMKAIIQSGITEIIYLDNHNYQKDSYIASRKMIRIHNSNPHFPKITLRGYKKSTLTNFLTTKTIFADKILVSPEEIEQFDNAQMPQEVNTKEELTLKLTFCKKENK